MSQTMDPVGAAPETRTVHFLVLLFGVCAAPIFWLGQLGLAYGITAYACFPGDHPVMPSSIAYLSRSLMLFDVIALLATAAGALTSWRAWRTLREPTERHSHSRQGRDRFLAMWGLLSSLWFFFAIVFNTIVSFAVPPCLN